MEINNVIGIQIDDFEENIVVAVINSYRIREMHKIKKTMPIVIEISSKVLNMAVSGCCTIFGNAGKVIAGNSIYIEGLVSNFEDNMCKFIIDKEIKVAYGNKKRNKQQISSVRHRIVRINGDSSSGIRVVRVNSICNIPSEIVVHGDVHTAVAGDCVMIKGNVIEAEAENNIVSTQSKRSRT